MKGLSKLVPGFLKKVIQHLCTNSWSKSTFVFWPKCIDTEKHERLTVDGIVFVDSVLI